MDHHQRDILILTTLGSFLTPFMGSSINIALPAIGKEFALNATQLGWIALSFLLSAATFLVPFGRIADIWGKKRIFTWGIFVFTVASLLSGLSPSAPLLISFRALQGIGSAMIFGTAAAILASVFPPTVRGRVLGINVAAVYLGLSLGPFLGGLLTQHLGWRSTLLIHVPLGLTVMVLSRRAGGEWAEARGERFDWRGSLLYSVALVALMCGLSLLPSLWGLWLFLLGVLGILGFLGWEARTESPILEVNLFRDNRVFALSNLAALINYSATFAVGFLLSLYLQYVKGLSPQQAGLILVSQPVVMVILSPLAGRLSDRWEPRIVASAGMALTMIALALFAFLGSATPDGFLVACLALLGLGLALFSSPNTNAIMGSVEKRSYGVASGTLGTMRLIGQMLSMGVAMFLITLFVGRGRMGPESYPLLLQSTRAAFLLFALLCCAGIFASLARGRVR
jgi:EmrB/QacA subfamily drug resistance transporter